MNMIKVFFIFTILFISKYNFADNNYKDLSMQDLGYPICHIKREKPQTRISAYKLYEKDMDVSPNNFRYAFEGTGCSSYQKTKDLDFNKKASIFIETHKNNQQSCKEDIPKNNCFGEGKVSNGYYIGQWLNNRQHGKGIQLMTFDFPFGFSNTRDAIYTGDYFNGLPHGVGKYENGLATYEGSWFMGEMHGDILWEPPDFYLYGFEVARDTSDYVSISKVIPFSSAANIGISEGDLLLKIETPSRIINTNEIGIKTLDDFFYNTNPNENIKIYIKAKDLSEKKLKAFTGVENIPPSSLKNFQNNPEQLLDYEKMRMKSKGIEDKYIDEYIIDFWNYFSSEKIYEINKLTDTPEGLSSYLCTNTKDQRCYQRAKYRNKFERNNIISRTSYLMGLRHAYNNFDPTIYYGKDGSMSYSNECRGKVVFTAFGVDFGIKGKPISKKVVPNAFKNSKHFFYGEDFFTPCDNMPSRTKWYLFFPEILIEHQEYIEEIINYEFDGAKKSSPKISLNKFDVVDYINEAIAEKENGRPANKTFANKFCDISIIRSRFCLPSTDAEGAYKYATIRRIANREGTSLNVRNKKNKNIQGKHNYIIASYCLKKGTNSSGNFEPLWVEGCLGKSIVDSKNFWKCVNLGRTFNDCNLKPKFINEFEQTNRELLESLDFSEWAF